jgi:hypothetical protein
MKEAWEAPALPLSYTRMRQNSYAISGIAASANDQRRSDSGTDAQRNVGKRTESGITGGITGSRPVPTGIPAVSQGGWAA